MKPLFNSTYLSFNQEGNKLADDSHRIIGELFDSYAAKGFNLRDIGHIIASSVPIVESERVIMHAVKARNEKKNCAPCHNGSCSKH